MLTRICSPSKKTRCSKSTNFLGISHSLHLHRRGQAALKHPTTGSPHKDAMNEDAVVAEGGAAAEVAEAGVEVEVEVEVAKVANNEIERGRTRTRRVGQIMTANGDMIGRWPEAEGHPVDIVSNRWDECCQVKGDSTSYVTALHSSSETINATSEKR